MGTPKKAHRLNHAQWVFSYYIYIYNNIYIYIILLSCILIDYYLYSFVFKNIVCDDKIVIREIREDGCPPFPPKNRHSLTCRRDGGNDSWVSLLGI